MVNHDDRNAARGVVGGARMRLGGQTAFMLGAASMTASMAASAQEDCASLPAPVVLQIGDTQEPL